MKCLPPLLLLFLPLFMMACETKETLVEVIVCADGSVVEDRADCPKDDPPPAPPLNTDGDDFPDSEDNCPNVANNDQADFNNDGFGDACQIRVNVEADIDCQRAEGELRISCTSQVEDDQGVEVTIGVERYRWDLNIGDDFTGITERTREVAMFFPPASIACEGSEGVIFNVALTIHLWTNDTHAYVTPEGRSSFVARAVNDDSDNLKISSSACS